MELKITKEKVLEASSKCLEAKTILKTLFPEAFENKIKNYAVYAFIDSRDIHILTQCGGKYNFVTLGNSSGGWGDGHDSAEEALESFKNTQDIKEFLSVKEFLKWAYESVK